VIVYAISDLHGNLPEPPADADLLLIAGDICPDMAPWGKRSQDLIDKGGIQQSKWLENQFKPWLSEHGIPTIGIWGNHDFVGEKKFLVPRDMQWELLQDTETGGVGLGCLNERPLRIWGTPWVPGLPYWAFYGRQEALQARADLIPEGLDVLMSHGPPRGHGDYIPTSEKQRNKYGNFGGDHVGDDTLNRAILRADPKVVICGHIHEARGSYDLGGIPVYNVSAVNENYVLHENPWTRLYELG
jgi:Icc-related predicted phosphoesterase